MALLSLILLFIFPLSAGRAQTSAATNNLKVLFTCPDPASPAESNLCVIDADGANPQTLVKGGVNSNGVWSRTGDAIFFAHDQGPVSYVPEGSPPGMPPIAVPGNTDIFSFNLSTFSSDPLTDKPDMELPLQALSTTDLLISKSTFVRQSSALTDGNHKLEIKLKLIAVPCLFSLSGKDCRPIASGSSSDAGSCPPLPLPGPVGLSPDGAWMAVSALLCSGQTENPSDAAPEPGLLLINASSGSVNPVFDRDLGSCPVFDAGGGRAVESDGNPFIPKFDVSTLKLADCRFYLSPDRQMLAFLSGDGQVQVIQQDGTNPKPLTTAGMPGVNALLWSPDGNFLLTFSTAGGPMAVVSTTEAGKIALLPPGLAPAWSPQPLPPIKGPASILTAETPKGSTSAPAKAPAESPKPAAAASGCSLVNR